MDRLPGSKRRRRAFLFLTALIFSLGVTALSCSPSALLPRTFAASTTVSIHSTMTSCVNPIQPSPNSNSLLVVLLDRSGSLVATTGATDPQLYSASVTRALADLWPGKMAVIAFNTSTASGSEQVNLVTIGPYQVGGDLAQRTNLKNQVQTLPLPHLGTPTAPAMEKALEIIKNENAPLSRVVLITDGEPGYTSSDHSGDKEVQEQHILNDLLPQFCAASVPVDTVGLETDAQANQFLSAVASGTAGSFQSVQDSKDLSNAVLSLDAQWQHRDFRQLQLQPDNTYHINVNQLTSSLHIFVFRSNASYQVTLKDPGGQMLNPVEDSSDRHYVLATLNLSTPFPTGDYTVSVQDSNGNIDTGALVYAFVDSQLQVQLLTPIQTTQIAINQPISIQARLLANQVPLPQLQGQAVITAIVSYAASGQLHTESVTLKQQGQQNLFSGQIPASSQPEAINVEVKANYDGVLAETDIRTQVVCGLSVPCLARQYLVPLLIIGPILLLLLLLLVAWLIWNRSQPAPCGVLRTPPATRRRLRIRDEDEDNADIPVYLADIGASRPLQKRLLERSVLTSQEIESHRSAKGGFDFASASFKLIFKGDCVVDIQMVSGGPIVLDNGEETVKLDDGEKQRLKSGTSIIVENKERAIFS